MIFQDYQEIEALTSHNTLSVKFQREAEALDEIIHKNPADLKARMKKGFILFEAHMDGRAIQVLNEILALDPNYIDAYIWLVEYLLFHWADAASAIIILQKAEKIAPREAILHYLWGCAYREQDDMAHFVEYMQKAIDLDPTLINPRMCLIEYLVSQKKNDEARVQLKEVEEFFQPNFPVPTDEMDYYYETLITGRVMAPYAKECFKKLQEELHAI